MKSAKSIAKKPDINKSMTIQDYFQSAPKECIKETRCNVSDTRAYYIEALKEKLKRKEIFVLYNFYYITKFRKT